MRRKKKKKLKMKGNLSIRPMKRIQKVCSLLQSGLRAAVFVPVGVCE